MRSAAQQVPVLDTPAEPQQTTQPVIPGTVQPDQKKLRTYRTMNEVPDDFYSSRSRFVTDDGTNI